MADQQIAAALMWVCGALVMGVIVAGAASLWLTRMETETAQAADA